MSVRHGILAILTIGPAYGHQILAEFTSRAPHRGPVNVGQIYATLERLAKQKLVDSGGQTDDGLPLHALTPAGVDAARAWMTTAIIDPLPDWTELLDQLLITRSVDPARAGALAESYERLWTAEADAVERAAESSSSSGHASAEQLALLARLAHARAVAEWIAAASRPLADPAGVRPLDASRPRRGRPALNDAPIESADPESE